uniref:VHS domain-containing protein n=1 Tax=Kalanchoe fedtschenkoi TaxID=63787 RepID=A0A7N0ZVJ9_KALFE
MDKSKIVAFGERLKIGGAQMSRMVSDKMKDLLQAPTPESKIVEEAAYEAMEEPNWGLNMRICAMINSEDYTSCGLTHPPPPLRLNRIKIASQGQVPK